MKGFPVKVTLFHLCFPEYVMGLANAMADHVDVTVIHPDSLAAQCSVLADPRIQLRPFPRPQRRRDPGNLPSIHHAFGLIKETTPDVLHVQETFDYAYDLYSLFARFPTLVTTIHDVVPHPGDGHAAPGLQYSKAIGCWRSARLIVHTNGMRTQLAKRFRLNSERIDVIPHGELGSMFQSIARNAGIPIQTRQPYTLLFFGRIWPYKGLRYLLEAFAEVKAAVPEARLTIAGKGGDLAVNAGLIASLQDVTVMQDFISPEKVAGLFESSSIVVLPYIEASQSGVSAIGFTTGAVIVASRVGGLADGISDGETGVLVEPRNPSQLASAIINLLQQTTAQQAIRDKAHSFASEMLSWRHIAASTLKTYRKAIDKTM